MELNISQVSTQAAAQASALASLLLLRKTLEMQAANIGGLVQAATPASVHRTWAIMSTWWLSPLHPPSH